MVMENKNELITEDSEGKYLVTKDGKVFRKNSKKEWVRVKEDRSTGYITVCVNGKSKYLHQIMAELFLEKPKGKVEIDHIDGNRFNNNIENLEWVSHRENIRRGYARKNRNLPSNVYKQNSKYSVMFWIKEKLEYFGTFGSVQEALHVRNWVLENYLNKA